MDTIICFLVDDDPDDQLIFELAINDTAMPVDCYFADNGDAALQKLNGDRSFIPHFIFLDLNMPRMNGAECLAHLKATDHLKDIPVIVYSTTLQEQVVDELKKLGAFDCFIKPPSSPALTALLIDIFNRQSGNRLPAD